MPGSAGIRIHRHVAEQPLADARAASRLRVRAAPFVGVAPRHEPVRANREIGAQATARAALRRSPPASRCAARPSRAAAAACRTSPADRCRRKSCVTWPTHDDRAKSGVLPVISTLPMRSVCRRRTPVDVATNVVAVWYSAYPNVAICARRASSYSVRSCGTNGSNTWMSESAGGAFQSAGSPRSVEQRHVVGRLGPALARGLRLADHLLEPLGRKVRARHRCDAPAGDRNHRQLHLVGVAVGRHRVVRPPDVDARDPPRNDDARIRLRQAQHPIDGVLEGDQCPSCAVLRMLICRKSAAGHPCETGAICPGCPLPQLNAPPST